MKRLTLLFALISMWRLCMCQTVTLRVSEAPAEQVFRSIMDQTGRNFVYPSEILDGLTVSVDVNDVSLGEALRYVFTDTDIDYKVKGRSIILKRKKRKKSGSKRVSMPMPVIPTVKVPDTVPPIMLNEVLVESRLEKHPMETAEIGAMKLSGGDVSKTPVLFGEEDVMKTLQIQPGAVQTAEWLAGLSVHGGETDQNMVMLDNVPLYGGDHCLGVFSAFNVDAIGHVDFYKSSMPARYDGRLSSYLDVRTKNGSNERRNGSFRLGLAAGAFSMNGPIGKKTTYSVALRRSWSEVLTQPIIGLIRLMRGEKVAFDYSFIDFHGKITQMFSPRSVGFVSVYYGDDWYYGADTYSDMGYCYPDHNQQSKYNLRWGNLVVQTGLRQELSDNLSAEFTLAYSRFFSKVTQRDVTLGDESEEHASDIEDKTKNNIGDVIAKGDFSWRPSENHRVGFGAAYTLHSFLPEKSTMLYKQDGVEVSSRISTWSYLANEGGIYVEDDWRVNERFRINIGLHASLFAIGRKVNHGVSPRFSLSYTPGADMAFKVGFSRTTQYVHRLCQSYLSLPTDQWIPITGNFKPESADKLSAGVYRMLGGGTYSVSVEGYMKYMHNLIDYKDEYYLKRPYEEWNAMLCSGKGTARGLDFKLEKRAGQLTGHIAYSLMKADRTFADKNGGKTFPSRLDHTHTVNLLVNWDISPKVRLGAVWTGHSGSRFTLMTQAWTGPEETDGVLLYEQSALKAPLNGYRLPFYHRLDLSCTVRNSRGYWNFSLYNAYCHMNTVGIRRAYDRNGMPVFQKISLLPIIPSASYTWIF